MRNKNGNRWRGVHRIPREQKRIVCKRTKVKTLLIAFSNNKGIIYKEFVPVGQTTNAAFLLGSLNRLLQRIRRVWPQLHRTGK